MRYLTILFLAAMLASCGGGKPESIEKVISSGDIKKLQSKKSELEGKKQDLDKQITQLEEEIKKLSPESKLPLVTAQKVDEQEFNHFLELQGNVATKKNLVLYPEYSGVLTAVYVKEGQKVSRGQRLAKIDDGGMSQQLAQMEIQAGLAKTAFERQERLWKQKIGTEMQYLQAKSNYEAQQKAVSQVQQQLAKTVITAPFSGTIDDVITEQGSVVSPGQSPVMRIVSLSDMYIEVDVPESHLRTVTKNKKVEVDFPILGKKLETRVRQAGNFINPANRTFKVEVAIPGNDKTIKPNLTAKVRINDYTNKKALLIPQSIVSENAEGNQYVYLLSDLKDGKATAQRSIVKTGKTQGDYIEILDGLNVGDEVVLEGARTVKEGQTVKVLETK